MTTGVTRVNRLDSSATDWSTSPAVGRDVSEPIDRAHLARYTLGDARLEREILGLFLAQLPLSVETLRFATTDRDWHVAAHTLKGSGRAVGAWRIAELAQQAERIAGLEDSPARTEVLASIDRALAEVEAYVTAAFPPEPRAPV